MIHLFDNNDHKVLQILGNMALYKVPMCNETMDEIMKGTGPVFVGLGLVVLVVIGIVLPASAIFAG